MQAQAIVEARWMSYPQAWRWFAELGHHGAELTREEFVDLVGDCETRINHAGELEILTIVRGPMRPRWAFLQPRR